MKPDPAAELFLTMAEKDFITVRKMADDPEFADEVFGFHAQQATEKAAKAILSARGIAFERIHDLELLFESIGERCGIDVSGFDSLIDLTDFAVQYRYQAFDEMDAGLDRHSITEKVRAFIDLAVEICRQAE